MGKITLIDRSNATNICNEMLEVLNAHFAEKGLTFTRKSGSYNAESVMVKVTGTVVLTADGKAVPNAEEAEYNQLTRIYPNLPKIGTMFMYVGKQYRIVGGSVRSRKFPILCTSPGASTRTKFPVSVVLTHCK